MRILTFTNLFPNKVQFRHGIFVKRRLQKLLETGRVKAKVVAPVPWFPLSNACFGRYAVFARIPKREVNEGTEVLHPRYPVLPRLGTWLAPLFLAGAMYPLIKRIIENGYNFDLIDAHYYYPDGVAAVLLAKAFDKPVLVTARGTDVNVLSRYLVPRRWITWSARQVSANIAVSQGLKQRIMDLGVQAERILVLRNGVDLDFFSPRDRRQARLELGNEGVNLLCVGNLVPEKGHVLAIKALKELSGVNLIIIGDGKMKTRLEKEASSSGVRERVRFVGSVPQEKLVQYYSAADALVLPSASEGMPNVILESIACGTPVVGSPLDGIREIVKSPDAGIVMGERSVEGLVAAVNRLLENYPDSAATRAYASRYDWSNTTEGQLQLFEHVVSAHKNRPIAI